MEATSIEFGLAETAAFVGPIAQPDPRFGLWRSSGVVANHLPVGSNNLAGPPLRQVHIAGLLFSRIAYMGQTVRRMAAMARGRKV